MHVASIAYLDWVKNTPETPANFAFSGRFARDLTELLTDLRASGLPARAHYGDPLLRERLAERYGLTPDHVVPAQGASQANFLVCAALLADGDEVIVERPAYPPLVQVPQALGAHIRRLDRTFEQGYRLDLDQLARLIGPRTRLLILTNLHNPSGMALDPDEIRQAAELLARVDGYLLVDEIYLEFLNRPAASAIHLGDNIVVTSSLTKAFGLGMLRCGWVLGPPQVIRRCWDVRHHVDVVGSGLTERLAALALPRLSQWLAEDARWLDRNRRMTLELLEQHPLLECRTPQHGGIVFPRFRHARDASPVLDFWRDQLGLIVGSGRFFEAPAHFRIGYALPTHVLTPGLERLRAALDHPGTRQRLPL